MERDRETTRNKLMDAVERIAVRDGFEACGVNAIAQEAGVDKVLIYRYFGGVDGLLSAVVAERAAWPVAAPLGGDRSPGSALSSALIDQARSIRARPLAQHAVAWEAAGHADRDIARPISEGREAQHSALAAALRDRHAVPARFDLEAVGALVAAGLMMLAARTDHRVPFFGLEVERDADWRRIEKAAGTILRALLDPSDA